MTGASIALVLGSAVLHAIWNRYLHGRDDRVAIMALSYLVGGVILVPWLVVEPPWDALPWVAGSVAFHAGYLTLLTSSYARGALSLTYPIARGVSPLLVALGAWILLDQAPGARTIAGIAVLTLGLFALAAVGRSLAQLHAVVLAGVTGVAITGYTLVDARAVEEVDPTGYLSVVFVGAGILVLGANRFGPAQVRASLRHGLAVGVMQAASYLLLLFALQRALAAEVASLRQLSVFIGVLIAREAFRRSTSVAAALVTAGAILIAW